MIAKEGSGFRSSYYIPGSDRTQLGLPQTRTHIFSSRKPAPATRCPCFPVLEPLREGAMCSAG